MVDDSKNAPFIAEIAREELAGLLVEGSEDDAVPEAMVKAAAKTAVGIGLDSGTFEALEIGPLTQTEAEVSLRLDTAEKVVDIHRAG
jgi:hypothetical protein